MPKLAKGHEEENKFTSEVMELMRKSPTSFHVCKNNMDELDKAGFTRLRENDT